MALLLSPSHASLVESIYNGTTQWLCWNKSSNQSSTLLSSEQLWHSNNNGMVSYEVWQRLSYNMSVYFAYYAGIMLDAFGYLLCFLLCWHNWPGPNWH